MKFKIILLLVLSVLFTACGGGGSSSSSDILPIIPPNEPAPENNNIKAPKQTRQVVSYDNEGAETNGSLIKDDGYYKRGRTATYTRNDTNETVLDNFTGLMWQDDKFVATVQKTWLSADNYFTCEQDNTSDACFDINDSTTALSYCSNMTLATYTNWRLPTVGEMEDLVNYGTRAPAIDNAFQNIAINDSVANQANGYWSSTTNNDNKHQAWVVYYYNGFVKSYNKKLIFFVRCVREN